MNFTTSAKKYYIKLKKTKQIYGVKSQNCGYCSGRQMCDWKECEGASRVPVNLFLDQGDGFTELLITVHPTAHLPLILFCKSMSIKSFNISSISISSLVQTSSYLTSSNAVFTFH